MPFTAPNRFLRLVPALFLVAIAYAQTSPQPTTASLAGLYDGHQMEVGAQLLLKPDGHFQYELAYGALDEAAEGTWSFHDGAVFLTTVPAARPPAFTLLSDQPDPSARLTLILTNGPLMEGAAQRVFLLYGPNERPDLVDVAPSGLVRVPPGKRPTAIALEIPVYPIEPKPIPLTPGGHRLTMRFDRNDIGRADFHAQRLTIENGVLVMPRRDLELILRFTPQPSRPANPAKKP